MKKKTFECDNCGNEQRYSLGTPSIDKYSKEEICDECYNELYQSTCPICEEYYETPNKPKDTFFYSNHKESGLGPGFYKVLNYPVYRSNGFDMQILESNVKKVSDNIVYLNDGYFTPHLLQKTEFICEDCFDKKGIDRFRVETHIRQELSRVVKTDKRLKRHKWIVKVSPEYFKGLETKNKYMYKWKKQIIIKVDKNKAIQDIEIIKQ